MMLQTDDYYKMLFLSIWLTMARVINVQLKSAWLFYFVFEVVYGGVFDGICMCWCLFVCVCVWVCVCLVYRYEYGGGNMYTHYRHAAIAAVVLNLSNGL